MSRRLMLDYIADAIIDAVLMRPHNGVSVRRALEQAYPFGDEAAGRLIWSKALLRHSHRIGAVESFLHDSDLRTETLKIDLSAELERVWKQENARRLLHQLASTYLQ